MGKNIVSVIIPAYNVEKYIDRCLESVANQTYGIENLEVIVVNDASTDKTLEHLEQFESRYPKNVIVVDCEENGKLGTARNIGMNYATGTYLTFVDSDDMIAPTMIEKMVKCIEENECDEVECGFKEFTCEDDVYVQNDLDESYYLDLTDCNSRKRFILSSFKTAVWGRLFRREFLEENGLRFLEKIFYEDVHFSGLSMILAGSYYRINETLYYYFINEEGIIHSAYNSEKVHQETVVLERLLTDYMERGVLDYVMENFAQEIEVYCLAKCFIDPLNMVLTSTLSLREKRREIDFFKNYIVGIFANAEDNIYLKQGGGIFAFGRWLLMVDETRTEKVFAQRGDKNIILINTHEYINIGDHLITEATYALLQAYYPDYTILEITANHFALEREMLKGCIQKGDVLVIVGGGYLGSLWLTNGEHNVQAIVKDYPNNRIVVFPQSMYYEDNDEGARELINAREIYSKHNNLHIVLRDERSYFFATKMMPSNVKNYYFPDTALCYPYENASERKKVALCIRQDKESVIDKGIVTEKVISLACRLGTEAVATDMMSPEVYPIEYRNEVVACKLEEFSEYKLVVTDRLHCMIMCAITGTPCVAIDNVSGKVSGVYKWIEKLSYIRIMEDLSQLENMAAEVFNADITVRPYDLLGEKFAQLAQLVAPVDMPQDLDVEFYEPGNGRFDKFIDMSISNENCNFRCEYCYIAQKKEYKNKLFEIPYDMEFMRRAFDKKRFGGKCLINMCGSGETLLSKELIPVILMLLEEGHYVSVVTNGTVTNAFDEFVDMKECLRNRLFIKFSFHYLELKRLNLFERFWENVDKMKKSGISYTLEITPCDNLIAYIADIKSMFNERAGGAMPHITVARDDRTGMVDILSDLAFDEYKNTWGVFDSKLFEFKMDIYHKKIDKFCMAGNKALSINLESGDINSCVAHGYVGNVYDDVTEPLQFEAIGCNCRLPYCFNGHVYMTLGLCSEIDAPTYLDVRDREDRDGNHWVNGEMRKVMSQKF